MFPCCFLLNAVSNRHLLLSPTPEPPCHLSPPSAPPRPLPERSTSCPPSASSSTPSSVTRSPRPACLEASLTVSAPPSFSSRLSRVVDAPRSPKCPRVSGFFVKMAGRGRREGTWTLHFPSPSAASSLTCYDALLVKYRVTSARPRTPKAHSSSSCLCSDSHDGHSHPHECRHEFTEPHTRPAATAAPGALLPLYPPSSIPHGQQHLQVPHQTTAPHIHSSPLVLSEDSVLVFKACGGSTTHSELITWPNASQTALFSHFFTF